MNEEIKKDEEESSETIPESSPPEEKAPEPQGDIETLLPPVEDEIEQRDETKAISPPEEESEEEVIFPMDKKERFQERRRPGFSIFNLFALSLLAVGVYLLGYVTNPEKFGETVDNIKELFSIAIKEVGPLENKITEIIESKVKNKPAANSTGSKTAGEETPLTSGKKIKYWQAPMNPSFIRDAPGKSPMGMDLIPIYEDQGEEDEQVIRIDPTITQNTGSFPV